MTASIKEKYEMANIHIVLTFACVFMLCYEFYYSTNHQVVRIKNPQFTLNTPYYNKTMKTNDIYEKLIDIKNFTFVTNPQPCKEFPAGLLLLIIVSSKPSNYRNRKVIRNTWGKAVHSTRLIFLIGETNNSTDMKQIRYESHVYGDIVQGTFTDAYRNMTYKHVMGLKWVVHHCPVAKYVLKTDDDVLLNSREMRRFLSKELSPWGAKGLIACQVLMDAPAQRANSSKWMVTKKEYAQDFYPTYCAGWAVLYSFDVVSKLLEAAQSAPYFWIDDVHVTGVLAERIGVARTPLNSLILSHKQVEVMVIFGPGYIGQFLLGPADLNVNRMVQLWSHIPA